MKCNINYIIYICNINYIFIYVIYIKYITHFCFANTLLAISLEARDNKGEEENDEDDDDKRKYKQA